MGEVLIFLQKILPREPWISDARIASDINPVNHPPVERLMRVIPQFAPNAEHIALLTTKYWRSGGVKLTVGFLTMLQRISAPAFWRT
jgi:hypothetical protein